MGLKVSGKKVIVFSTPTCSWCRKLKSYLKENKIRFVDVDVSKDPKAVQDMIKRSGKHGVPQIWINNKPVIGFEKEKIDRLLKN